MRRVDRHTACTVAVLATTLAGCVDSGERAAQTWMQAQPPHLKLTVLAPVPPVIDTPPVGYNSKVANPFLPERTMAPVNIDNMAQRAGVLFPEVPVVSLIITGYLSGDQRSPIAIVHGGAVYQSVRMGDRLGREAAMVKQIGAQGVLIALDGVPDRWLPINQP